MPEKPDPRGLVASGHQAVGARMTPTPTSVQYNDWLQVAVEPRDTFTPTLPVSVIIPYYQTPVEILERTLAALEGQIYPRDLFEVLIIDDGSQPPLASPPSTALDIRVVRQERCGFGLARARNTGARAASHNILLFLDSDMLAEADWITMHARWHHAVSDALTLGMRNCVAIDGIDAETIRHRKGSLHDLFVDQSMDSPWIEGVSLRSRDPLSRTDDLFRETTGGNFGIGATFYWSVGGFDESFTRYGAEDTEFGYRAYTRGGLLVPVRETLAWHSGRWQEDRAAKKQAFRIQRGKAAHLIAHPAFRGSSPGRIFQVPQYVVTINAGCHSPDAVVRTTVDILADRTHDLVIRIEAPAGDQDPRLPYLREVLGPDPRVRLAPPHSALDDFPASPFHVTLPAGVVFARGVVHRLRAGLGDAVSAVSILSDGSRVSLTRAWALHRARRVGAGAGPADFGAVQTISAARLKLKLARPADAEELTGHPTPWDILFDRVRGIRSLGETWLLLQWLAGLVWRRTVKMLRTVWWLFRRWTKAWRNG